MIIKNDGIQIQLNHGSTDETLKELHAVCDALLEKPFFYTLGKTRMEHLVQMIGLHGLFDKVPMEKIARVLGMRFLLYQEKLRGLMPLIPATFLRLSNGLAVESEKLSWCAGNRSLDSGVYFRHLNSIGSSVGTGGSLSGFAIHLETEACVICSNPLQVSLDLALKLDKVFVRESEFFAGMQGRAHPAASTPVAVHDQCLKVVCNSCSKSLFEDYHPQTNSVRARARNFNCNDCFNGVCGWVPPRGTVTAFRKLRNRTR
jgi:hypothetical protein